MKAEGDGDAVTWRFEVLIDGGPGWLPYDPQHFPDDGGYQEYIGQHVHEECWDDLTEVAEDELARALGPIAADAIERAGFDGLRVCVWRAYDNIEGDPEVVLHASPKQLAAGRLRAAAQQVAEAMDLVEQARRRLRWQIVTASSTDDLPRPFIAAETEAVLQGDVRAYLAGHDVIEAVRRALPREWSREAPLDPFWGEPMVEENPDPASATFWCGPVCMNLTPAGEVLLHRADREYTEGYWCCADMMHRDCTPERIDEIDKANLALREQRAERARAQAAAIWPLLRAHRILLRTAQGEEASVKDLAAAGPYAPLRASWPWSRQQLEHQTLPATTGQTAQAIEVKASSVTGPANG
ncbi:hypothetical protein ACSNOI_45215 [Actinomadura kijaniata]|uniref:hypothetical protein n=1 Tax=Actinomadura kijaniata TaxID=46161 RepID=UPI003F1DFD35